MHPADPLITALLIIILAPDNTGSIEVIFSYPQIPAENTGPDLGPCVSLNARLSSRLPAPTVSWTPRWHSQNGPLLLPAPGQETHPTHVAFTADVPRARSLGAGGHLEG